MRGEAGLCVTVSSSEVLHHFTTAIHLCIYSVNQSCKGQGYPVNVGNLNFMGLLYFHSFIHIKSLCFSTYYMKKGFNYPVGKSRLLILVYHNSCNPHHKPSSISYHLCRLVILLTCTYIVIDKTEINYWSL